MPFLVSPHSVCFIASHGGSADHFATFFEHLSKDHRNIQLFGSGPAVKKFEEKKIRPHGSFSIEGKNPQEEDDLAEQIAKACSLAYIVITDVGNPFDIKIQKALALHAPKVIRYSYYDNPEPYVPGGYSEVATQVMLASQGIIFANANLAESFPLDLKKIGIGYYPISQAEKIAQRRAMEHREARCAFFAKHHLEDKGQKVLVYFGGNNEEYFSRAFPAFLEILKHAMNERDLVIVLQQHPAAKTLNRDVNQCGSKIIISDFNSDEAQVLADVALYYQTSMGPQFILAGIPTIQIGHEPFQDILVKNGLCPSVTTSHHFLKALDTQHQGEIPREIIFNGLGIKENWLEILKHSIKRQSYISLYVASSVILTGYIALRIMKHS